MAERERERAEHAHALDLAGQGGRGRREVLGARGLECDELQARQGTRGADRDPADARAAAAPPDPLLAAAEVVDVAEDDVVHRGAVRDGDRERVERQAALGVEAAVDRIDDDAPGPAAAVDALARLLRDHRETDAVAGDLVEDAERGVLGRLVDGYRRVTAGAAAQLVGTPRPWHGGDRLGDGVSHRAADREPALGGHGSNGSSWLKTMPSRIFGKKNVDFGGIV